MLEKLEIQEKRFKELEQLLSDPAIIEQRELWQNYSKRLTDGVGGAACENTNRFRGSSVIAVR